MSILGANLKLYSPFQRQPFIYILFLSLLVVFYILSFVPIFAIKRINSLPHFIDINIIQYFMFFLASYLLVLSGYFISIIQMDIISKPFSFCLPGHQEKLQNTIFIFGIFFGLIFTANLFLIPTHVLPKFYILIILPGIILSFYLFSIFETFYSFRKKPNGYLLLCLYITIVLLLVSICSVVYFKTNFKNIFFNWVALFSITGIFLLIAVWRLLGNPDLRRNALEIGPQSERTIFNPFEIKQWNEIIFFRRLHKDTEKDCNDSEVFLTTMKKQKYFSIKQSLTGLMYLAVSRRCSFNKKVFGLHFMNKLILMMLILIATGYLIKTEGHIINIIVNTLVSFLLIYTSGFITEVFTPSFHKPLLPVGRVKKFLVMLIFWLIKSLVLACWAVIIIAASFFVQHYIPAINFAGYILTYNNYLSVIIFFPLALSPVIDLGNCTQGTPRLFKIAILLGAIQMIFFISFSNLTDIKFQISIMALMIIISNVLSLIILYRYCFKSDHV